MGQARRWRLIIVATGLAATLAAGLIPAPAAATGRPRSTAQATVQPPVQPPLQSTGQAPGAQVAQVTQAAGDRPVAARTDRPRVAHVGVLAFRGADQARARWQPLADYLGASVEGWDFVLVPVTLVSAPEKIESKQIDFLITNPGHYVTLADQFALSVLATRERRVNGVGLLRYGSAIFCRRDAGIASLADLRGKRLAAVSPDAFGGFQLAWHEFRRQQIDPFTDLGSIRFMGFPQDAIVEAVASGEVDAGVVRAGLLENLAAENRIRLEDFRVLQDNSQPGYPYKTSGALYPEWPFTALPGIDKRLREQVTHALLDTQQGDIARQFALRDLWSAPLSYENVRMLVRDFQGRDGRGGGRASWIATPAAGLGLGLAAAMTVLLASVMLRRRTPLPAVPAPEPAANPPGQAAPPEELARFQSLTRREREVLSLICVGKSSRDIADQLGISPKTVEYHRSNLLQKSGARTSAHLVQLVTRLEHDLGFSLGDFAHNHE